MRRIAAMVGAIALWVSPAVVYPAAAAARCRDEIDAARLLRLIVEGETARGRYALPFVRPRTLVVFAHGYGHTSASWVGHMRRAARDHGVIAVAMDYRGIEILPDDDGDGLPESRGWNVAAGAADSIAAARFFEARCRSIDTIVIFGVSMGGNTSGLAVAESAGVTKSDGSPLFDYWFDIEGATNMSELYLLARAIAPVSAYASRAVADMEAETGGSIDHRPREFLDRTVIARISDIAASGIDGVAVVHGIDDGLVPYDQGRQMASALAARTIPTDLFTVVQKDEESEAETTVTGHAMSNLDSDWRSPLAGHASEVSRTHIVMKTAFRRLWALLDRGRTPGPYREFVVDGVLGTIP